jgi:hypothetical protein
VTKGDLKTHPASASKISRHDKLSAHDCSRYIRYHDNIGDNKYGEDYNIGKRESFVYWYSIQ